MSNLPHSLEKLHRARSGKAHEMRNEIVEEVIVALVSESQAVQAT